MLKEITTYVLSIPAFYSVFTAFGYITLAITSVTLRSRSLLFVRIGTFTSQVVTSYAAFLAIYLVFYLMSQQTSFVMFIIPLIAMVRNDWTRITAVRNLPDDRRSGLFSQRTLALVADLLGFVIALFVVPDAWKVWQILHYVPTV